MQRELQGSEINEYKSFQYFMNEFLLINLKFFLNFCSCYEIFRAENWIFKDNKYFSQKEKKNPTYRLDNFILWHTSPSLSFHKNQT